MSVGPSPQSLASVDGEIMPTAEATVPVHDEGLVRGDGVFEVMRVYDGVPFALEEHLARLERSGRNMRLPVDLEAVRADIHRLLARAGGGPAHAAVRVMLTRGGRRILITEEMHQLPGSASLRSITYSPTHVLDGVKSLSYGANRLASRLAQEQGYDEALLVTPHGRVLEAPTSSLFWVKDGELLTPPLSDHILASITRAIIIEVTGAAERATTLDELLSGEEAFLASTLRDVQPVGRIDEREFDAPGPVTAEATQAVERRIAELLAR